MQQAPTRAGPGVLGAVGDLVEDIVVWADGTHRYATDNRSTITRSRGGSAANVAALSAAIVPSRFIGCVGTDPTGDAFVADLAARGVDVRVQRRGRTGTVVVLVDSNGERTMYPDRAAAGELRDVPLEWLEDVQVLHVPSYSFSTHPTAGAALALVMAAAEAGIEVSVDASSTGMLEEYGVAHYLELLETIRPAIFFANSSEAALLDVGRPQFAKTLTIVKDGERPTRVRLPGGMVESVPVPPAEHVRDSTGAGDAFAAGFLAAHLRGSDPITATRAGHALARTVLMSPGAASG